MSWSIMSPIYRTCSFMEQALPGKMRLNALANTKFYFQSSCGSSPRRSLQLVFHHHLFPPSLQLPWVQTRTVIKLRYFLILFYINSSTNDYLQIELLNIYRLEMTHLEPLVLLSSTVEKKNRTRTCHMQQWPSKQVNLIASPQFSTT